MNRRQRILSPEDQELLELQEALSALTVRVAELRNRRTAITNEAQPLSNNQVFVIGARVHFQLNGHRVEGVIIDQTPHRFRIRHIDRFGDNTGDIYLRSGTTITLIV
jgi:hypothetical protein